MGSAITLAGESLISQKTLTKEQLDVVRFLFARVPGLDPAAPIDRAAPRPSTIVHSETIPAEGKRRINEGQVVYSVRLGSDVGDFDFNWLGLETAEGVLLAVSHVPLQQKRRALPPLQFGNNLTRNFLLKFDGAQALTGLTIDASTWQHDFTVRLGSIDERERLSNRDIYGRSAFFGDALRLQKVGSTYQLSPGIAYAEGIRVELDVAQTVNPPALPARAWLDVTMKRELNDVLARWAVVWGSAMTDYTDIDGARHYCIALADVLASGSVIDIRSSVLAGTVQDQLSMLQEQSGKVTGLKGRLFFIGQF